jgi:plastocyanin
MRSLSLLLVGFAALAMACGGDDDGGTADASTSADAPAADAPSADADPAAPDANPNAPDANVADANVDAKVSPVVAVDCVGAVVDVTVTVARGAFVFDPDPTIPLNGIARFTPGSSHDATSGANRTADGLFLAPPSATTCFKFTEAATYPFYCSFHPFGADLVVAP